MVIADNFKQHLFLCVSCQIYVVFTCLFVIKVLLEVSTGRVTEFNKLQRKIK